MNRYGWTIAQLVILLAGVLALQLVPTNRLGLPWAAVAFVGALASGYRFTVAVRDRREARGRNLTGAGGEIRLLLAAIWTRDAGAWLVLNLVFTAIGLESVFHLLPPRVLTTLFFVAEVQAVYAILLNTRDTRTIDRRIEAARSRARRN